MASSRGCARVLALAVMLMGAAAHAEPTPAEKDVARGHMAEGEEKRERGDLEGALKSFRAADAIMHVPTTGLEVARTEAAMGRLLEAQEMARAVTRIPIKRNEPRPFTVAREGARALDDDLERRIPAIMIQIENRGRPTFNGEVRGAQVTLDGVPVLPAHLGLGQKVNPGHHVVVVQSGDSSGRAEVDVLERESRAVVVTLVAPEPVASNATAPIEPPPKSPESRTNYLAYTGFGVGAAGIAVGAVTGVVVLANAGDLRDTCNNPPNTCNGSDADKLSSTRTWATVSTVAFIVGGAGIAVGVGGLLFGNSRPSASTATAKPAVEPFVGLGSAGIRGRF